MNYHRHLKTPDHHISTELIEVSECATRVTQDGGALSFQNLVHTLKFEHKIILKHPQNMCFSQVHVIYGHGNSRLGVLDTTIYTKITANSKPQ